MKAKTAQLLAQLVKSLRLNEADAARAASLFDECCGLLKEGTDSETILQVSPSSIDCGGPRREDEGVGEADEGKGAECVCESAKCAKARAKA